VLVVARLVQGLGAALMAPAALSQLAVTFREGRDRNVALGAWGAVSGVAAAAGVFLGGAFAQGPGWRWVFFVNPPICLLIAAAAAVLLAADGDRREAAGFFDWQGAVLVTGGMLALVYGLVRAPTVGWTSTQSAGALVGSGALLTAFLRNELTARQPLVPFAILRVRGLLAANLTQLIAFSGFIGMFFFATLYMQETLSYSPLRAGAAYLPVTAGFAVAGGIAAQLLPRVGTRPVVVAGCLVAASGIGWVSRVPAPGSYPTDILPGFLLMALGAGAVFVAITAAANAGVPADQAGLAAGLLNSSQQLGSALGLAVLSAVAATHSDRSGAVNAGYHRALLLAAIAMAAAAAFALRTADTRAAAPLVMVNSPAARPNEPAVSSG
jgi:MFS family permease